MDWEQLEEVLPGGTLTEVVRVGDTVRRPAGPWTPAVHALLDHLEAVGFEGSPRFLGADARGREILTFLPGSTAVWPWPSALLRDVGIRQFGLLLRKYHDAVSSFVMPPGVTWRDGTTSIGPNEIVRHGDAAPWNTLWDNDHLVGLIDWDLAHPGPAFDDVLNGLWHVAPLYNEGACREADFAVVPNRLKRVQVFLEAYGETFGLNSEYNIASAVLEYAVRSRERESRLARNGLEPWLFL